MRDLCKWPMSLSTFMLVCGYMLITMWSCPVVLYVMPFFWRQTYLSFKFFLIVVYSLTSISVVILFQESADICEFSYLLYYYCFYAMKKKLEMHMRNKQYITCRSQNSQHLVIFLRRCMSGYVEGYDVGLKQRRFEAEQCGCWMKGCRYADCFIMFFHNN